MIDWGEIQHFTEAEFACKCGCGRADMAELFVRVLDEIRSEAGFAMVVTSGFRCDAHNEAIGGGRVHPLGVAADIAVHGEQAYTLLAIATEHDMPGIGLKQHGDHSSRYVHLDMYAGDTETPRPWVWTYS